MQIKNTFPNEIRVIEHVWIPMRDGKRLAARIWLPVDAEQHPVPALLEYLPYRKNDGTRWRDSIRHPYLAGHGYAAVRVDMRGNGDSDGLMLDEYTPTEQDDALQVLAWLEAQPWCTGKVGIFGKSWGGFNGLQIAALRPPQLKAIITIASTDDRYADDVHYMGGCVLGSQMLSWASTMLAYNACPPDPHYVGTRWRNTWRHRLENTPPFSEAWLAHQRRDAFWQHGSVCEDYSAIECAVYAVGSWADGYTNAVPRLLAGLTAPRKGLLGPWAHNFPENSSPQPAIGFLQESLRWWDYWLKGRETGIMDEPTVRTWMQDSFAAEATRREVMGRWVVDEAWPSPNVADVVIDFAVENDVLAAPSQFCGIDSGLWLSFGADGDFASDQRGDNALSLCYTTDVQPETAVLGHPRVNLTLKVDQPQAALGVRLCDVAPDGRATLVSWGLYNLSHRNGHDAPEPMPVNTAVSVTVSLNLLGHTLKAGHRWQVAISTTFWPHLWPSPKPVTLTVEQCQLVLPLRVDELDGGEIRPFPPPECAPPIPIDQLTPPDSHYTIERDRIANTATITHATDSGDQQFPDGLRLWDTAVDRFEINEHDPLSAKATSQRTRTLQRGEWRIKIITHSEMSADETNFYLFNHLTIFEGGDKFLERVWKKTIPRDHQ